LLKGRIEEGFANDKQKSLPFIPSPWQVYLPLTERRDWDDVGNTKIFLAFYTKNSFICAG